MIVDDTGVKMVLGAMVSRDINTLTAVGGTSINGGAPPSLFGARITSSTSIAVVVRGRRIGLATTAILICGLVNNLLHGLN